MNNSRYWISVMWLLVALLLLSAGCAKTGSPIHIVVPAGFRGPFQIVEDKKQGVTVPELNKRRVYVIPPDGVLRVDTLAPFQVFHEITASFSDGKPLPLFLGELDSESPAKGGDVALHLGGTIVGTNYPNPTMEHFVGTLPEYKQFLKKQSEAR